MKAYSEAENIDASADYFSYLYEDFFSRVFKFVSYRINNIEDAKDLTTTIFIKIYKNLKTFDPEIAKIDVWIFTIARNEVINFYRKQSKFKMISLENFKNFFVSEKYVHDNLENLEEKEVMKIAISHLSDLEKEIISYKYGAELSNSDIAKLTKQSYSNVGVILHRSLKKIKEEMNKYYEE